MLICPKCAGALTKYGNVMKCPRSHSYDIASQGYVNLLMSGKSGDTIGDSKQMIAARRNFLDAGHYVPLSEAVCKIVQTLTDNKANPHILDAGCGEGYYTSAVARSIPASQVLGVEISRNGCLAAAKRDSCSLYVTASASAMPVESGWADVILSLFAPTFAEEFQRVLRKDGVVLQVAPGKNHLIEIKCAVYDEAYLNDEDKHALDGFTLISSQRVEYQKELSDPVHIQQLFAMTPYPFHTSREGMARLNALTQIRVTMDFLLLVFKALPAQSPSGAKTPQASS